MNPLVLVFNPAAFIRTEIILERTKANNRAGLVGSFPRQLRITADELPTLKVDVRLNIFLPRTLNRRLESQYQDF
jgi:hypothetical protein